MMKKEKGFYISLLSGIVCIAVVGAICMNLFAKPEQKEENVPIAEETLTIKKAGIGKTVSITAKAMDGSRVQKVLKVKVIKKAGKRFLIKLKK